MAKGKDPADIGKEQGSDALRGITDRDPGLSFEREEPAPRPNGRRRKANGEDHAPNLGDEAPKPARERKGKEGNGKPHANDVIRPAPNNGPSLGTPIASSAAMAKIFVYVHPLKAWFIWDGVFWRRDDSGDIMRRAEATIEAIFDEAKEIADEATRQAFRKFALKSQTHGQFDAMVQLAQHNLKVVLSPDKLDTDPMLLGVLNGTIDLNTGTFREAGAKIISRSNARLLSTRPRNARIGSSFKRRSQAATPTSSRTSSGCLALLLTGEMVEILFILHGEGKTEKRQSLKRSSGVLGDYAHAADAKMMLSPNDRSGATPEIVALKGKRAIFINETDDSDHLNESRVKYCDGNDTMSGRDLFESTINFRPTHKTLLQDKPQAKDSRNRPRDMAAHPLLAVPRHDSR